MDFLHLPFKEKSDCLSFKLRKDLRKRIVRWRRELVFKAGMTAADGGLPHVDLLAEKITNYIRQTRHAGRSSSSIRCVAEEQMQNKAEATNTPRRGLATWPSAPDVVPIPRDEVRVFLVNLHGSGSLPRHKSLLSSDEIDRANSYAQTRDRDRFIARRGFLRELVAGYTGIKSAHIGLQYSASGRPHLSEE
jgi:hypothetical protein